MKNTLENKAKFFSQYWGQRLVCNSLSEDVTIGAYGSVNELTLSENHNRMFTNLCLELTPLLQISDEDAIEVAKLAHQCKGDWSIERRNSDIFLESDRGSGMHYGIRIGTFYHGDISSWWRFDKKDNKRSTTHTINIGKINVTDSKPIPYIAIVDFLRSKSYALPWNGISVKEMIEWGWIKLKE
jgi:hypothetical protein